MKNLFNVVPRHKKPTHAEMVESETKGLITPNTRIKQLLAKAKKKELTDKEKKELKRALISGVIFIDLENKIRRKLKCLQTGR